MPISKKRIILDTNIFISFLINQDFSGLDNIIIERKATLIFSKELIEELLIVLDRPKFKKLITDNDKNELISFLENFGELIKIKTIINLSRDSKDDFLLSLAVDGDATHLITGDKDLLVIKKIKKTKILTIKEFLAIFN
jgi:hypothetical protein